MLTNSIVLAINGCDPLQIMFVTLNTINKCSHWCDVHELKYVMLDYARKKD